MDTEKLIESAKEKEDLLQDIPTLKKIINNLGTRIKKQGDLLYLLELAVTDIQSYSTEEGQKKLKQDTYNYVISSLREEMFQHKGKRVETINDIMKMLPIKMFRNSGRQPNKES